MCCFHQPCGFSNINRRVPNVTFQGRKDVKVGDKEVQLIQTKPAHTKGDVLVYVPDDKCVFTGDILFIEGHPILWAGPVGNWIEACQTMLDMDLDLVVPGHGPITDKQGVKAVQDYLVYIRDEGRKRYDAGMSVMEAAADINFSDYDSWGDGERIAVNLSTLYKEFAGDTSPNNVVELFGLMAQLHKQRR